MSVLCLFFFLFPQLVNAAKENDFSLAQVMLDTYLASPDAVDAVDGAR